MTLIDLVGEGSSLYGINQKHVLPLIATTYDGSSPMMMYPCCYPGNLKRWLSSHHQGSIKFHINMFIKYFGRRISSCEEARGEGNIKAAGKNIIIFLKKGKGEAISSFLSFPVGKNVNWAVGKNINWGRGGGGLKMLAKNIKL